MPPVTDILLSAAADISITTVAPPNPRSRLLVIDLDNELPLENFIWIGTTPSRGRRKRSPGGPHHARFARHRHP